MSTFTDSSQVFVCETSRRRPDFGDINVDVEKIRTLRIKPSLDADRDQIRQRVGEVRQVNSFFKMRCSQRYRPAEKGAMKRIKDSADSRHEIHGS